MSAEHHLSRQSASMPAAPGPGVAEHGAPGAAPSIIAIEIVPRTAAQGARHVAVLTVRSGVFTVKGIRLFEAPDGSHYLRGPALRTGGDAVNILAGLERNALLDRAIAMFRAVQEPAKA